MGKKTPFIVAISILLLAAALLVVRSAPRKPPRTLHAARDQLVQAWNSTHSVRARMEMRSEGPAATLQRGTYEMKSAGDRRLVRVELTLVQPAPAAPAATPPLKITSVSDGRHTYVLTEHNGQASARKSPLDPSMQMDPVAFFREMEQHGDMELRPDEVLDNRPVTVIRVVPKGSTLSEGYVLYSIAQDCGLIVQLVATETASGTTTRAGLSDIQLNVDIPDDRFVFQPPPGVPVQDLSAAP